MSAADPQPPEVLEVDAAAVRRARTFVVLEALRRVLGPDNVDGYEDHPFRIGVSLADGQFFDVEVCGE